MRQLYLLREVHLGSQTLWASIHGHIFVCSFYFISPSLGPFYAIFLILSANVWLLKLWRS